MNYSEAIDYLYNKTLVFQHIGAAAYKPGLETTQELSGIFGNPHTAYKTIHVAGTNGKGSVCHTLASVLQAAGYSVGLYTSPHLLDFRERIRVNGKPIDELSVCRFVEAFLSAGYDGRQPSFFELATIMAFDYFKRRHVDVAVVEVGLGGRLDSTNIITPSLSVITNISLDHTQFLGNTLAAIAGEKAGIIKSGVPVVIGEDVAETRPVFSDAAHSAGSEIVFARDNNLIDASLQNDDGTMTLRTKEFGEILSELNGSWQVLNANTVLNAVNCLRCQGFKVSENAIKKGFGNVCESTGLMGRWMKLSDHPLTICNVAHNPGGFCYIAEQLATLKAHRLHIVIGFVSDKDFVEILSMLPKNAGYYFTQPSVGRALDRNVLHTRATDMGLKGNVYASVADAYEAARQTANQDDAIYVGGSCFVVADLLAVVKT